MKANVDYNDIMNFKNEIEELYSHFQNTHQKILKILEDSECIDDDKIDSFHSYIKEYESKLETLKSDFYQLSSENKKLESCLSQVKLLKKRRVTKIESNMKNSGKKWEFFDADEEC
jgi:uncharacterized coiled-coil DUF342 family protein